LCHAACIMFSVGPVASTVCSDECKGCTVFPRAVPLGNGLFLRMCSFLTA
jgi:hypothetical protein